MNYTIKIVDKADFDRFYKAFKGRKTFLQSVAYGQFREALGETIFYIGIFSDQKLVGISLLQKVTTRLKTFLHIPHGPLIMEELDTDKVWKSFLDFYKHFGKERGVDFLRISPLLSPDKKPLFCQKGFVDAPVHLVNPEKNWILDITEDLEVILSNMKKSTRYEVRQIDKKGLTVKQGNAEEDLDIFWKLHLETVKRQKFTPFPKANTAKEMAIFGDDCQIFSTMVKDDYYSASIIIFDDTAAYYHQGASRYSKLPVAHATIWAAIKEAKKRGCRYFNFWGVVSDTDKKHPWYGLSRFKRGFGGYEENYLHCQDYPLTFKYRISAFIEKYRKWKRGY